MKNPRTILIADDDKAICMVLERAIRARGFETLITDNAGQLVQWVEKGKGDAVITDVLMPGGNGLDALTRIKACRAELPVIVISAQNTLITAVRASQLGAYEYLPKPFDLDVLVECVEKAVRQNSKSREKAPDGDEELPLGHIANHNGHSPIIGRSPAMQEIYRTLARMVNVDLTVMITGESGTGKELVARALHMLGPRKEKAFIALNMAAIPRDLVESELFGHEKGSFTGAVARKAGAFEQAEGGTLFLDEIGDMPIEAQTRLLRVLQQGEYTAVGSGTSRRTDVRIVTATHRELLQWVKKGSFREDLYYRLNVVPIHIPPLRERGEDISELVTYFLAKARSKGLPDKEVTRDAMKILQAYNWPGNVRELENLIYRTATLHAQRTIDAGIIKKELSFKIAGPGQGGDKPLSEVVRAHVLTYFQSHQDGLPASGVYARLLPMVEKPLIEVTLEAVGGNQLKAAEVLGINRNTLRKKMTELDIRPLLRTGGKSS